MCGPTAAQTDLQNQQIQFYQTMQQQDQVTFGEDQQILTQMQSVYAPILAAGPNQFGFSAGQTATLNSQATEGVAQNFQKADTALKEQNASAGGDSFLPTGVQSQEEGELDTAAAQEQSQEEQQIQQAGYAQGYSEFTQATNALQGTAGLLNPNGTASTTVSSGSAASSEANTIASQEDSWEAPVLGAVGAVGAGALGGYTAHH